MYRGRGKIAGTEWVGPVIMIGAVVGGGYLLYKLFGGGSGGLTATGQNNQQVDQNSAATAAGDLANAKSKGIQVSLPETVLNGYADSIYQIVTTSTESMPISPSSASQVLNIVDQVNNDADWFRLVQIFGTKKFNTGGSLSSCALSGGLWGCDSLDLPALLRLALPPATLSNLNSYFSDQGMSVQL